MNEQKPNQSYPHPFQRLVMCLQFIWMEAKAKRYERKTADWQKMIVNNKPFVEFYREWADELRKKLDT